MRTRLPLLLALILPAFFGCSLIAGDEVARLPINRISTSDADLTMKEASLKLKKGEEIAFWSDMDMEYKGELGLYFEVEVLKNGAEYKTLELDAMQTNVTMNETRTSWNDEVDWSYEGKSGDMTADADGDYTFKAYLIATENPTLKLKKGELVLRK